MNSATESEIREYQQKCFSEYLSIQDAKGKALFPKSYTYPDGNPIRPLPPAQTACGGLMIVGAYPSARFESRPSKQRPGRRRLVPVADNLHPFADETYFDGLRLRVLESAKGLRKYLLCPLRVDAERCWITDLVKVFLYKPEHVDSCGDACPGFPVPQLRTRYAELAQASLPWIKEECGLCRPKLVVTLGEEVAQAVSGERNAKADDLLNRDVQEPEAIGRFPALYLPHPDACRRNPEWREQLRKRRIPLVKKLLEGRAGR